MIVKKEQVFRNEFFSERTIKDYLLIKQSDENITFEDYAEMVSRSSGVD